MAEHAGYGSHCQCADAEVARLTGAVEWAARIFIAIGHDMGTFDPDFPKDSDERDMLVWLGAFAPSPITTVIVPSENAHNAASGGGTGV